MMIQEILLKSNKTKLHKTSQNLHFLKHILFWVNCLMKRNQT